MLITFNRGHHLRAAWAKILVFRKNNGIFFFKMNLHRIFWLRFEISASEFTPVPNFQLNWTKDKETRILT